VQDAKPVQGPVHTHGGCVDKRERKKKQGKGSSPAPVASRECVEIDHTDETTLGNLRSGRQPLRPDGACVLGGRRRPSAGPLADPGYGGFDVWVEIETCG
jgi:hypothetical protein